ncbi:MAG: hypothetical protein HRU19_01250 [Pseudobacteriovorax sp.]|nr:hypothetical protein [Pseudobacteriovorax sp.]
MKRNHWIILFTFLIFLTNCKKSEQSETLTYSSVASDHPADHPFLGTGMEDIGFVSNLAFEAYEPSPTYISGSPNETGTISAIGKNMEIIYDSRMQKDFAYNDFFVLRAKRKGSDIINQFVVFRGTATADEWLSNFNFLRTQEGTTTKQSLGWGSVQRSWFRRAEAITQELVKGCDESSLLQQSRKNPVFMIGHSRGGALALLTAANFLMTIEKRDCTTGELKIKQQPTQKNQPSTQVGGVSGQDFIVSRVYLLGTPKVGDQRFADHINKVFGDRVIDIVAEADPVPHLPATKELVHELAGEKDGIASMVADIVNENIITGTIAKILINTADSYKRIGLADQPNCYFDQNKYSYVDDQKPMTSGFCVRLLNHYLGQVVLEACKGKLCGGESPGLLGLEEGRAWLERNRCPNSQCRTLAQNFDYTIDRISRLKDAEKEQFKTVLNQCLAVHTASYRVHGMSGKPLCMRP